MSKSHYIIDPDEPTRQPMGCGRSLGIFIAVVLTVILCLAFPSCRSLPPIAKETHTENSKIIHIHLLFYSLYNMPAFVYFSSHIF